MSDVGIHSLRAMEEPGTKMPEDFQKLSGPATHADSRRTDFSRKNCLYVEVHRNNYFFRVKVKASGGGTEL